MSLEQNNIPKVEENIFTILLSRFVPYWPLFVMVVPISLFVAWIYLKTATPVYEATATLIIKDENKGVDDAKMMDAIDAFDSKKIVENEIEVIRSRFIMNQVVDSLCLYAPIFEKKTLGNKPAYDSSPVLVQLKKPKRAAILGQEDVKMFFNYDNYRRIIRVNDTSFKLNEWVEVPGIGELRFKENPNKTAFTDRPLYCTFINPKTVSRSILGRLAVSPANKLSTVISLVYRDLIPSRGEHILNYLVAAYNQKAVTDRNLLADSTLKFIEERMDNVEKELFDLEGEIQTYRSTEGVVDLSEQGKLYLKDVVDYDRQIADINRQLAVLKRVEKYVISKKGKSGVVPSTTGINDFVLTELLQKLYSSEIEYEKLRKTTAENNPILVSVANEIQKIRPSILETIRSHRNNLRASLGNLTYNSERSNSELKTLPEKERTLVEISRRKAIKSDLFSFLQQKREETALSFAPNFGDGKVVDFAESTYVPVNPKPMIAYLMALVGAFLLAISYVLFKEILGSKVLFRSEIERYTNIPVVAELSFVDMEHTEEGKDAVKNENSIFKKALDLIEKLGINTNYFRLRKANTEPLKPGEAILPEQFRQLGASLGLYDRTFSKKRILVTSSVGSEGKSFVSTNLAYSLAQAGKKIALLDMDFIKPYTSEYFDLTERVGILDLLDNRASYQDVLNSIPSSKNLKVVPTGDNYGDYTKLLLNGGLDSFFEKLSKDFDYVIMDSAPVDLVADVNLLSEYSDQTLFVIRHDSTPKHVIKNLGQSAMLKKAKDVAIVFNGVKKRGMINEDLGYGYGYHTDSAQDYSYLPGK